MQIHTRTLVASPVAQSAPDIVPARSALAANFASVGNAPSDAPWPGAVPQGHLLLETDIDAVPVFPDGDRPIEERREFEVVGRMAAPLHMGPAVDGVPRTGALIRLAPPLLDPAPRLLAHEAAANHGTGTAGTGTSRPATLLGKLVDRLLRALG